MEPQDEENKEDSPSILPPSPDAPPTKQYWKASNKLGINGGTWQEHEGQSMKEYCYSKKFRNNPNRFHPEGSPYLGLSVKEQKALSRLRRGSYATPAHIKRQQRKATREDYSNLGIACCQALLQAMVDGTCRRDRATVEMRVPFNFRRYYDKDLPRPFILAYDDYTIVGAWRAKALLDWLQKRSLIQFTYRDFIDSLYALRGLDIMVTKYLDLCSNEGIIELFGHVSSSCDHKRFKSDLHDLDYLEKVLNKLSK